MGIIASKKAELDHYGKESILTISEKKKLKRDYRERILDIANKYVPHQLLTSTDKSNVLDIVVEVASVGPPQGAGLVIAGFGEKDIFPSLFEFNIKGVLLGKIIKTDKGHSRICENNSAIIKPFAQSDDIASFIAGIGNELSRIVTRALSEMLNNDFPSKLLDTLCQEIKLTEAQKKTLLLNFKEMGEGACEKILGEIETKKEEEYIYPIITATRFLGKAELAEMAESLVSLVSFKKRVTMVSETVGGPIDVAVITKGDGFIWTKRKHYFDGNMNHHFFHNYFRKDDSYASED